MSTRSRIKTLRLMLARRVAQTDAPVPGTSARMVNALWCERKALEWALELLDPRPPT